MKEFNPTKKDLLLIEELIIKAKEKKNKIIATKISFQNELEQLKMKYREVQFRSEKFYEIKERRSVIKDKLASLELKISSINNELFEKNKMKNEVLFFLKNNISVDEKKEVDLLINNIKELKKKYSEFTSDRTRIASLRVMASEFIQELDTLLTKL
jgi:hypothetical protein